MSRSEKLSNLSPGVTSRTSGRAVGALLRAAGVIDLELDRVPSMSFLDGLVRELRETGSLENVTLVTSSSAVLRNLGRFVAHDAALVLWTRSESGERIRVAPTIEDPLDVREGVVSEELLVD